MTKKLIAIPEGRLMQIAETKELTTLSALKDKTTVDRKTLRAINDGESVKESTLQKIADKLRLPLTHFTAAGAPETSVATTANTIDQYCHREIIVTRLDSGSLRELVINTDEINWSLKIEKYQNRWSLLYCDYD